MQPSSADQIAEIAELLRQEHRVEGASLAELVPACRRKLPRRLRRDADFLAAHEPLAMHPKLRRQLDLARLDAGCNALAGHLRRSARRRRRVDLLLTVAGSLALALLGVLVLLVVVLRWRGFI